MCQLTDLDFAWRIVKHVKSNAIVVVKNGATLGVGAGQMNRVGSAKIALEQAEAALKAEGKDIRNEALVLGRTLLKFFPENIGCTSKESDYTKIWRKSK